MKELILASGHIAQVDDADYEYCRQFEWYLINGYARREEGAITVYLHIEILKRQGFIIPKGMETDHLDRDRLNDQRHNLKIVTRSQNQFNTNLQSNNTSGTKGVYFDKNCNKWRACIQIKGRTIHLGSFENIDDAIRARKQAEHVYIS